MDSLIAAAGRALAAGDTLSALKRVAMRTDPPALALRGIAMAQLGELARARELLRHAARGFGKNSHEVLEHARCVVAEAEVALAMREGLGGSTGRTLAAAAAALDARADHANATHARRIAARRLLLVGRIDEAAAALAALLEPHRLAAASPQLAAVAELVAAEIALRRLRTAPAQAALQRARAAAERSRIPALQAEVAELEAALVRPAARRWHANGVTTPLRLAEVEALLASGALVVDACRRGLARGGGADGDRNAEWLPLRRRPVLFALARALAEGWPGDVDRDTLIERAFRTRRPDETHRARLRVEIGRLRALAAPLLLRIEATARGFALVPGGGGAADQQIVVLVPPIEGEHEAPLQALLADGAAWSTSALALALGESQRTVQRTLAGLEQAGLVRSIGRARSQRWLSAPLARFTTILLLPPSLPPA
jgi:DNA-binding transcriptional ArsR family regulator